MYRRHLRRREKKSNKRVLTEWGVKMCRCSCGRKNTSNTQRAIPVKKKINVSISIYRLYRHRKYVSLLDKKKKKTREPTVIIDRYSRWTAWLMHPPNSSSKCQQPFKKNKNKIKKTPKGLCFYHPVSKGVSLYVTEEVTFLEVLIQNEVHRLRPQTATDTDKVDVTHRQRLEARQRNNGLTALTLATWWGFVLVLFFYPVDTLNMKG